MKKLDYYYAKYYVSKMSNLAEYMLKSFIYTSSKGLTKKFNLKYGDNKRQRLDLIYNEENNAKKPIVFYIHGGGFVSGTLTLRRPYCYSLAQNGYFVANIDYTLAPDLQFPQQFQEIAQAMEYVLDRAEEYNLDTSKIILAGESAGAYFASYFAMMSKNRNLYDLLDVDFKYKDTFEVLSSVLICGVFDIASVLKVKAPYCKSFIKSFFDFTNIDLKNEDKINRLVYSPLNYIDCTFPPCVVLRGKHDVFDKSSKILLKVLQEKNAIFDCFLAKGISGVHAGTIAPINKEGKRALAFTLEKLADYCNNKQSN